MNNAPTPKFEYVIDWDKVNTLEDLKEIVKGLGIKVDPSSCSENLLPYITKAEE